MLDIQHSYYSVLYLPLSSIKYLVHAVYLHCISICIGATSFSDAHFGQGSGDILLNNVDCSGTESSLLECSHPGIGAIGSCSHGDDAGVNCRESKWIIRVRVCHYAYSISELYLRFC